MADSNGDDIDLDFLENVLQSHNIGEGNGSLSDASKKITVDDDDIANILAFAESVVQGQHQHSDTIMHNDGDDKDKQQDQLIDLNEIDTLISKNEESSPPSTSAAPVTEQAVDEVTVIVEEEEPMPAQDIKQEGNDKNKTDDENITQNQEDTIEVPKENAIEEEKDVLDSPELRIVKELDVVPLDKSKVMSMLKEYGLKNISSSLRGKYWMRLFHKVQAPDTILIPTLSPEDDKIVEDMIRNEFSKNSHDYSHVSLSNEEHLQKTALSQESENEIILIIKEDFILFCCQEGIDPAKCDPIIVSALNLISNIESGVPKEQSAAFLRSVLDSGFITLSSEEYTFTQRLSVLNRIALNHDESEEGKIPLSPLIPLLPQDWIRSSMAGAIQLPFVLHIWDVLILDFHLSTPDPRGPLISYIIFSLLMKVSESLDDANISSDRLLLLLKEQCSQIKIKDDVYALVSQAQALRNLSTMPQSPSREKTSSIGDEASLDGSTIANSSRKSGLSINNIIGGTTVSSVKVKESFVKMEKKFEEKINEMDEVLDKVDDVLFKVADSANDAIDKLSASVKSISLSKTFGSLGMRKTNAENPSSAATIAASTSTPTENKEPVKSSFGMFSGRFMSALDQSTKAMKEKLKRAPESSKPAIAEVKKEIKIDQPKQDPNNTSGVSDSAFEIDDDGMEAAMASAEKLTPGMDPRTRELLSKSQHFFSGLVEGSMLKVSEWLVGSSIIPDGWELYHSPLLQYSKSKEAALNVSVESETSENDESLSEAISAECLILIIHSRLILLKYTSDEKNPLGLDIISSKDRLAHMVWDDDLTVIGNYHLSQIEKMAFPKNSRSKIRLALIGGETILACLTPDDVDKIISKIRETVTKFQ